MLLKRDHICRVVVYLYHLHIYKHAFECVGSFVNSMCGETMNMVIVYLFFFLYIDHLSQNICRLFALWLVKNCLFAYLFLPCRKMLCLPAECTANLQVLLLHCISAATRISQQARLMMALESVGVSPLGFPWHWSNWTPYSACPIL